MLRCKLKKIEKGIAFGYDEGSLKCMSSRTKEELHDFLFHFPCLTIIGGNICMLKTKVEGLVLLLR
ncbi:hypothetical protein Pint_20747 [Pistacia integerrima]|uniref:Uncharacterized protein n=1 Tax=Pistacia integerrima TaxID=434235 RepID=A0ACC0XD26_9ROSI|nr:hypothetical protein Pint_20747 [Pistacia integerrima]